VALLKDRANTIVHLAENARHVLRLRGTCGGRGGEALDDKTRPALRMLAAELAYAPWERKSSLPRSRRYSRPPPQMPALAMPARLLINAARQTPSLTR